ncbi:MAG: glycine--tRNA ligase subunit beta [Bryobacterales bacterium]|nr:glycine--tRNA ligase subunit beta [Bryobacterales bacterium]
MSDLLLEVGTEEIPARLVPGAMRDLEKGFRSALRELDLKCEGQISVDATPRRLALVAEGLPDRQRDRTETLTGPSKQIAFDPDGNPTRAALGFARKAGVAVEELELGDDGKLTLRRTIAGQRTHDLLAHVLADVVLGVRFPRSMYWMGKGSPRFIRPIRWLVALLDGDVVPVEFAGVRSGNVTWGHRRLGTGPITVNSAEEYRSGLRANAVLLAAEGRASKIVADAEALLPAGYELRRNQRLLQTLVFETEHPTAVLGSFDESYLDLPEEVLETVMLVHQKYFAVEDSSGAMTNRFVAIANSASDTDGVIRRGHERVLRARFNDARFFWQFDQRSSLSDRLEELKAVTFQASLGSYWSKTETNLEAVAHLNEALSVDASDAKGALRAARLAKTDLTTEMVGEFPELQGKIGGLYATAQGESQEVADAIYDHYLPAGGSGPIPRSLVGQLVSLADRLATLGGMFRIGLMPTGSKDPLALRRAALGVIRIVLEGSLAISLDRLVAIACAGDNAPKLRDFLLDRLRFWLQESGGFGADSADAVLAASDAVPVDVLARARALAEVRHTSDFEALAVSFKRIRNILEQSGTAESVHGAKLDLALLEDGAEADLHASLQPVGARIAECNAKRDYATSLRAIATLRPALDRYFDDVLVMAEDDAVRLNRLVFLASMLRALSTIADFSLIDAGPAAA